VSVARFIADQRTKYGVPHTLVCALLGVSLALPCSTRSTARNLNASSVSWSSFRPSSSRTPPFSQAKSKKCSTYLRVF
jgi:hypothetical protein